VVVAGDAFVRSALGRFEVLIGSYAEAESLVTATPAARSFFVSYLLNNRNF
jgi:hypothetical protein